MCVCVCVCVWCCVWWCVCGDVCVWCVCVCVCVWCVCVCVCVCVVCVFFCSNHFWRTSVLSWAPILIKLTLNNSGLLERHHTDELVCLYHVFFNRKIFKLKESVVVLCVCALNSSFRVCMRSSDVFVQLCLCDLAACFYSGFSLYPEFPHSDHVIKVWVCLETRASVIPCGANKLLLKRESSHDCWTNSASLLYYVEFSARFELYCV